MIAYELPPIDYWTGTAEFDPEHEAHLARQPPPSSTFGPEHEVHERAAEITRLHRAAELVFERLSWEGDGEWRYGALPGDTSTSLWISVKQENNGTTFVLSPVPMPWLDDIAFRVLK